jgi:nicotinate-nucleotide pyrophosphorylase (carboxylating)
MSQSTLLDTEHLKSFIENALKEDIGSGDHSSMSCIPEDSRGSAQLLVKENGILAGVELATMIFNQFDPTLELNVFIEDGAQVNVGDVAFTVSGSKRSILATERLVLNCMQRMSGIATQTRKMIDLMGETNTKILDTRKTTPGMRIIEKWAVRIGGGYNHRFGLYDMIMLKDNHIDFAGGIQKAIEQVVSYCKQNNLDIPIEVEVRNEQELNEVIQVGKVQRIMLDNFTPDQIRKVIPMIPKHFETEASGGITERTIADYAQTGVDFISVGAITHSVKSLDLSLKAC